MAGTLKNQLFPDDLTLMEVVEQNKKARKEQAELVGAAIERNNPLFID